MAKGKHKSMEQQLQSERAHSKEAAENLSNTMPTYHKDKHEPNRPSTG
ncbi:hypothetical protein [Paenibacillus thalictri]|nr:hypothetical protein [Paenibacillus thalictri]